MKARNSFGIVALALLLLSTGGSWAQAPKPGSGLDAANFMPTRERVRLMETFWAWKKSHVLPFFFTHSF